MAIKVFIAGDVVPRNRTVEMFNEKRTEALFDGLLPIINEADIKVVNLEAPVKNGELTPIKKSGPVLSCTKETVEVLKDAGFNVVTLANNHFRDQGDQGVKDTIDALDSNGMLHVGGGINHTDAKKIHYHKTNEGIVAFINACEHEFSIAAENRGGSNGLDLIALYDSIIEAKRHSDFVLLIIHGGIELYQLPTPRMKKTYRFFIDVGADAVVNHHQHCFSGYEIYKGKPIFYGLGNFCFDWEGRRNSIWNRGYAVTLSLKEKIDYEIHPYLQCDEVPSVMLQDAACYNADLDCLNKIISNDKLLEECFIKLTNEKERNFLYVMSPFDNRYIAALNRRGILKSLYPERKLYAVKNMIWCESHREILMEILNHSTDK